MKSLFKLYTLADTQSLAKLIAQSIMTEFVITLDAELGAGKTTLVRDILYALGVVGGVKSPTYTIVEPYEFDQMTVYHFDLYRFNDPEEWFDAGLDEYFNLHSICFIEWAEKAIELIPVVDWQLKITLEDETRLMEINAISDKGIKCLNKLINIGANLYN